MTAEEVIHLLGLKPHPEGGFYRETFREPASTAIYFLLRQGDVSAWHRMQNAAEVWHYYAGAPFELTTSPGHGRTVVRLGPDIAAGEVPQVVVEAGVWQTARLAPGAGEWGLVGCTVAPAFRFTSFDMAPPDWEPKEG
ncbi:MAG: cupin domain-containing protein [Acidobacteriota bacterium]